MPSRRCLLALIPGVFVLALVPVCRAEEPAPPLQVRVQAKCVRVPAGFCERAGFPLCRPSKGRVCCTASLSAMEAKLLAALLSAEPGAEVLSNPQLVTQDGMEASCAVGQTVPVVGGLEPVPGGKGLFRLKTSNKEVGVTLSVTPKVSADGKYVNMTMSGTLRELSRAGVSVGVTRASGESVGETIVLAGEAGGVVNEEVVAGAAPVRDGGTAMLVCAGVAGRECLWIFRVEVIRPESFVPAY